jgi:hypothetical protein
MIRGASKNHNAVTVVTDTKQYAQVIAVRLPPPPPTLLRRDVLLAVVMQPLRRSRVPCAARKCAKRNGRPRGWTGTERTRQWPAGGGVAHASRY